MNEKPIDLQESPGQILRTTRENYGISINEVTQKLFIDKRLIHDIEEDNYNNISAKVYAEGYLKSYANFLNIPATQILEIFRKNNIYDKQTNFVNINEDKIKIQNFLKDKKIYLFIGIVLIFIVTILIIFFSRFFTDKNENHLQVSQTDTSNIVELSN